MLCLKTKSPIPDMPVTFAVAPHKAREYRRFGDSPDGVQGLLKASYKRSLLPRIRYKLRQTSVKERDVANLEPRNNGFVYAVLDAYAHHHNLCIRYVVIQLGLFRGMPEFLTRSLCPDQTTYGSQS